MNKVITKIGVMGGTFNPIHNGHLKAAEICRLKFGLELVYFITSGEPPHKDVRYMASREDRYNMTASACQISPYFVPSRIEIDRVGRSYSIDTVKELRRVYPRPIELYFITGADAIAELETWKSVEELVQLCSFIAVTRPGYDEGFTEKVLNLKKKLGARILTIQIPPIDISSTKIRRDAAEGRSIEDMVPPLVASYINERGLYGKS